MAIHYLTDNDAPNWHVPAPVDHVTVRQRLCEVTWPLRRWRDSPSQPLCSPHLGAAQGELFFLRLKRLSPPLPAIPERAAQASKTMGNRDDEYDFLFKGERNRKPGGGSLCFRQFGPFLTSVGRWKLTWASWSIAFSFSHARRFKLNVTFLVFLLPHVWSGFISACGA